MKTFVLLFVLLACIFVAWKFSPEDVRKNVRGFLGKISVPLIAALAVTALFLAFAFSLNMRII